MSMRSVSGTMERGAAVRHAATTIALHWSTVAAVVIAVVAIYLRDVTEDKPLRQLLLVTHRQLGLLILIGVPVRILVRYWLGSAHASVRRSLAGWATLACHVALCVLLAGVAVIGWTATSAKNTPLQLLGVIPLPSLTEPDPDVADTLLDYHQLGAWTLLALAGLHALAALWHHYYLRDTVLTAMLPRFRTRSVEKAASAAGGGQGPIDLDELEKAVE
jgi:superoxide oxidase